MKQDTTTTQRKDTMHTVGKFSIALPLMIMVFALVFATRPKPVVRQNLSLTPTVSMNSSAQEASTTADIKIDLKGPLNCAYKTSTQQIKVAIKDEQVAATIVEQTTKRFIIRAGDCVYLWNDKEFTGQKICGVNQYASMFGMVSSLPFFKPEMLLTMLNQMSDKPEVASVSQLPFAAVMKQCKKSEVDTAVFNLPTNITFELASPAVTSFKP
ncbi:MAG: hypothetical protein ACEQSA_03875 [Weeksellaceae bacterium]